MNHAQEQRRKQAVVRYLAGDKIEAICRDLHCSTPISAERNFATIGDETAQFLPRKSDDLRLQG